MSAPTPTQIDRWRDQLAAHTMLDGECPVCKVPYRCRPWADAFGDLVAHGVLPEAATPPTGATESASQAGA